MLPQAPHSSAWLAIRRPLLVAFVFGCAISLRRRRTVVYDRDGGAWGDSALIQLAAGCLRDREPRTSGALDVLSRTCGLLGLIGLLVSGNRVVYSAMEKEIVPK
jgi:hypothetical protein